MEHHTHKFGAYGRFEFTVKVLPNYLEYTILDLHTGDWRRKFVSKAGYTGDLREVMEVGMNILHKLQKGA